MEVHSSKYEKVDSKFPGKVKNHFYVDNLNTGVYSTEEGFVFYKKMKVYFNVRKWRTNDEGLYKLINLNEKNASVNSRLK